MENPSTVITPFNGPFYQPDWRHRLATQIAADSHTKHPAPAALRDELVRAAARYLRAAQAGLSTAGPLRGVLDRIRQWGHDSNGQDGTNGTNRHVGHVIEALLLTDAPLDALASDVGCSLEDIRYYVRLFFDVRDDSGNMTLSPAQKAFFATEGAFKPASVRPEHLMWRRVAMRGGYQALMQVLELGKGAWAEAPTVDLVEVTLGMGKAEALAKLASGAMSTSELSRMESNRIKDHLVRHTTGELRHKDEAMETLLELMQMMAPTMVSHERIVAAQAGVTFEGVQAAEEGIEQTEANDQGVASGNAALDRLLDKKKEEFRKIHNRQKGLMAEIGTPQMRSGLPAGA